MPELRPRFYTRPRRPWGDGWKVLAPEINAYDVIDRTTGEVVGYAAGLEARRAAAGLARQMDETDETVTGGD